MGIGPADGMPSPVILVVVNFFLGIGGMIME